MSSFYEELGNIESDRQEKKRQEVKAERLSAGGHGRQLRLEQPRPKSAARRPKSPTLERPRPRRDISPTLEQLKPKAAATKRERSRSPTERKKRGRSSERKKRGRSSERMKRERSRSPLERVKRERSRSPLERVRRERSRSPLERVKRERSRSPPERVKRDGSRSPKVRAKQFSLDLTLGEFLLNDLRRRPPSDSIDEMINSIRELDWNCLGAEPLERGRICVDYDAARSVLIGYNYQFAHELCSQCFDASSNVICLPAKLQPRETLDSESEAEYVHPQTLSEEASKLLSRRPAWSTNELCVSCNEQPRNGKNAPFARGTKLLDGSQRFGDSAKRFHDAAADAKVITDGRDFIRMAETALPYAGTNAGERRKTRLRNLHQDLLDVAGAVWERIDDGPSDRSTPLRSYAQDDPDPDVTWIFTISGPVTYESPDPPEPWLEEAILETRRSGQRAARKVHFNERATIICHDYQVQREDGTNYVYLLPPAESSVSRHIVRSKGFDGPSENQVKHNSRSSGERAGNAILARKFSLERGTLSLPNNISADARKFREGHRSSTKRCIESFPAQRHDAKKIIAMFGYTGDDEED